MRQERGREAPGTPGAQCPTQALNLRASSKALGSSCLHSSPATFLRNPPWPPSVSKQRPPSRYTGPKTALHFSLDTHSPTSLRGDFWGGRTWLAAPPCMLTASSPCQVQGLATSGDDPPRPRARLQHRPTGSSLGTCKPHPLSAQDPQAGLRDVTRVPLRPQSFS